MRRYRAVRTLLALAACLSTVLLALAHTPSMENTRGFLFDPTHTQFSIPLHISVALLGFSGDGGGGVQLDAATLQRSLLDALPIHVPANVELQSEDRVQVHLAYEASHVPHATLLQVEATIKRGMKLLGQTPEGVHVYDVDAHELELQLDELYTTFLAQGVAGSSYGGPHGSGEAARPPLAMLLLNPDKQRMNPTPSGTAAYMYRYRYEHGAATQQFVARQRYIVADLSAGPCAYGPSDTGEGTVSRNSVPSVEVQGFASGGDDDESSTGSAAPATAAATDSLASVKFVSELSSFILSGVRHVLVGDLAWRNLHYAEKVLVPVVVFRNHRRFHPLRQVGGTESLPKDAAGPVNEFKIDLAAIKMQARKLLLPEQELLVVHGTHHLHDHHSLSTAVFKALKSDSSTYTAAADGSFSPQAKPYLDSRVLIEELENASDEVIAGLLKAEGVGLSSPLLPGTSSTRAAGHRILPVFVLSLLGMPPGLLLDRKHLHVATSRCVLVLQTASPSVPVSFMSDGAIVHLNPRTPTRHVIAGLATALGGVGAPYQRFSVEKKRRVHNFLWAQGAVPWGVFSNSTSLSQLFGDQAVRNGVCARVSSSMRSVNRAMRGMRAFHREYIEASDLEPLQLSRDTLAPMGTADNRGSDGKTYGVELLARDVSVRLAQELNLIEQQFLQLSADIKQHRWSSATRLSGAILITSRAFAQYVDTEIDAARRSLECCRKVYSPPAFRWLGFEQGAGWLTITLPLLALVALGAAVFACVRTRMPQGPATLRGNNPMLRRMLGGLAQKQRIS